MVLISKGPFLYGDERKKVMIDDYCIDLYPVTNVAYRKFNKAGGYENQAYWTEQGWAWKE